MKDGSSIQDGLDVAIGPRCKGSIGVKVVICTVDSGLGVPGSDGSVKRLTDAMMASVAVAKVNDFAVVKPSDPGRIVPT
jgi:hypothetical protein